MKRLRGGCSVAAQKGLSVGHVTREFVLQSQFLFLQAVEKVFVGVGSVLFLLDEGVKSLVLRLQFLDHCLVHWCRSFRQADVTAP